MNSLKFNKMKNQFNAEFRLPSFKIYSDKVFNKNVTCYKDLDLL